MKTLHRVPHVSFGLEYTVRSTVVGWSVVVALALLASNAPTHASGYPHTWIRNVLVGHDATSYYLLSIVHTSDGNYYRYEESVFLDRHTFDGDRVERVLFRHTVHRDSTGSGNWTREDSPGARPELAGSFLSKPLRYTFSTSLYTREIAFDPSGMLLRQGKHEVLLMPAVELSKYLPSYTENLEFDWARARLTNLYETRSHFFVEVHDGMGYSDGDATQAIVPIERERMTAAFKALGEMNRN